MIIDYIHELANPVAFVIVVAMLCYTMYKMFEKGFNSTKS